MKRTLAVLFIALTVFVALAQSALAHAQLDHCTPAPGTAVSTAPTEVRCWFTEEIDSKQSTLMVTDANNAQVDNKDGKVDLNVADHKQMFATVKSLPSGVYKVTWHTVTTDDNGVTDGTFYFGVGQVTVPTYVPPTSAAASTTEATQAAAASTTAPTTAAAASTPAATQVAQAATPSATATAGTPAATAATSGTSGSPTVSASPVGTAAPTVAATPVPPVTPVASGTPLVIAGGVLEAMVVIGVLVYLFRKNP